MSPRLRERRRSPRASGVWLVTYADLMTILVCFFALIISYSIQDQVKHEVVAGSMKDAFGVAEQRRYAGDIRLEGTPEQRQPGNIRPTPAPSASGIDETLAARPSVGAFGRAGAYEAADADRRRYEAVGETLASALAANPLLRGAGDAITLNLVEDGLEVVLVDADGAAMFESGSASLTPRAGALLAATAAALRPLPHRLIVEGHADATGGGAYSPFDLTSARANAARRALEAAGIPADRIASVAGRGAADPLYPEDPFAPGNRRIEIRLEPAAPLLPEDAPL